MMQANRRKNILETPRRRRRKRQMYIWRGIILGIFFLIIIAAIIGFFHLPFLQVKNVEVVGTQQIDPNALKQKAEAHMQGSYYFLIPKTFVLLYPKKEITNDILSSFKDIDRATISIKGFDKVEIAIHERSTFALYCLDTCFVFDDTGYIYKDASTTTEDQYVIFRDARPEFASSTPLGTYPLKTEIFTGVEGFAKNLAPLKVHLRDVVIGVDDTITIATDEGNLIVSYRSSLSDQMDILKTALSQPLFENPDGSIKHFNYIDLRFGNKIFYKLGADASPASSSTSTASSTQ